jgi:hypothetical protein
MVVDRVHDLPVDRVRDLADLADEVGATLWLIWSSPDTDAAELTVKELTARAGTTWGVNVRGRVHGCLESPARGRGLMG